MNEGKNTKFMHHTLMVEWMADSLEKVKKHCSCQQHQKLLDFLLNIFYGHCIVYFFIILKPKSALFFSVDSQAFFSQRCRNFYLPTRRELKLSRLCCISQCSKKILKKYQQFWKVALFFDIIQKKFVVHSL